MESSRGCICAQCPLTVPSRTNVKSLTSIPSHRNTCPVMATRSTRIPSPETWSDSRVALPEKTHTHINPWIEDFIFNLNVLTGIKTLYVQLKLQTKKE